jgi:hypothetical protein
MSLEWQVRITLDRSALAPGALDRPAFWYVGFHDETGAELARADANREELVRLLSSGSDRIVLDRRFRASRRPASWSIHPTDRRRVWLDRISGEAKAELAGAAPPLLSVARRLHPFSLAGGVKIRAGGEADGGYVMLDDPGAAGPAYSYGIGADVSWDLAMAERGLIVHQYDHTVAGPPSAHENFRFNRLGLAPDPVEGFVSLGSALEANGDADRDDMILKIDIEGAEWAILEQADSALLGRFRQILIEYHGLTWLPDPTRIALLDGVLEKLNRTHAVHHLHPCNFGNTGSVAGILVPDVIEVSYARRDLGEIAESDEIFPTPLDRPCNPAQPEIALGRFRFS